MLPKQVSSWRGTMAILTQDGGVGGSGDGAESVDVITGTAFIVVVAADVLFGFGCPSDSSNEAWTCVDYIMRVPVSPQSMPAQEKPALSETARAICLEMFSRIEQQDND
jgi:hypothetical protein